MVKTLADFKRLPVGTKILTVHGAGDNTGKIRKIEHKQTNAIRFEGGSWLQYPSAKEFRTDGNTIIIESRNANGDIWSVLEYRIVEEENITNYAK